MTSLLYFSDSMSCLQAIDNAKFEDPMIKSVLEKCHFLKSTGWSGNAEQDGRVHN